MDKLNKFDLAVTLNLNYTQVFAWIGGTCIGAWSSLRPSSLFASSLYDKLSSMISSTSSNLFCATLSDARPDRNDLPFFLWKMKRGWSWSVSVPWGRRRWGTLYFLVGLPYPRMYVASTYELISAPLSNGVICLILHSASTKDWVNSYYTSTRLESAVQANSVQILTKTLTCQVHAPFVRKLSKYFVQQMWGITRMSGFRNVSNANNHVRVYCMMRTMKLRSSMTRVTLIIAKNKCCFYYWTCSNVRFLWMKIDHQLWLYYVIIILKKQVHNRILLPLNTKEARQFFFVIRHRHQ